MSALFRRHRFIVPALLAGAALLALRLVARLLPPTTLGPLSETVLAWTTERDILLYTIIAILMVEWRQIRKESPLAHRDRTIFFPFTRHTSLEFGAIRKRFQPNDIQPRQSLSDPAQDIETQKRLLTFNRILVTGRSGVGKTRLCVDLMEQLCAAKGEEVTILVPEADFDVPSNRLPDGLNLRNVILFIDEFHRHVQPEDSASVSDAETDSSIEERLAGCIEFFARRATDLRVVLTASSDPESGIAPVIGVARDFEVVNVEQLHRGQVNSFALAVASALDLQLSAEAIRHIEKRSDLTCAGIVTALVALKDGGFSEAYAISRKDVEKYDFGYPKDWEHIVFPKLVRPIPTRLAVFQALAVLANLRASPWTRLVVELAARLLDGRSPSGSSGGAFRRPWRRICSGRG